MRPIPALYRNRPAAIVEVDQTSADNDLVWILGHPHDDERVALACVGASAVEPILFGLPPYPETPIEAYDYAQHWWERRRDGDMG